MKTDFFNKELNLHNISHAYLFECKDSNESHKLTDNFIKKILVSKINKVIKNKETYSSRGKRLCR